MNPNEIIEQLEIEENRGAGKSSHTTNPTTCADVRRSGEACGICGSFNLVSQGVYYCESCDAEKELLETYTGWWWSNSKPSTPICDCADIENKNGFKVSPRKRYSIAKCLDCGAIHTKRLCPNCKSVAWKHWDGRVKCRRCGFTVNNATYCGIGAKVNKAEGKLGTKKAKAKYMSKRQKKRFKAKNRPHPNKIRRNLIAADEQIDFYERSRTVDERYQDHPGWY